MFAIAPHSLASFLRAFSNQCLLFVRSLSNGRTKFRESDLLRVREIKCFYPNTLYCDVFPLRKRSPDNFFAAQSFCVRVYKRAISIVCAG